MELYYSFDGKYFAYAELLGEDFKELMEIYETWYDKGDRTFPDWFNMCEKRDQKIPDHYYYKLKTKLKWHGKEDHRGDADFREGDPEKADVA